MEQKAVYDQADSTAPTDVVRDCVDCGKAFMVTVGEQEWLATKGFELPKRCPSCRRLRRQEREAADSRDRPRLLSETHAPLAIKAGGRRAKFDMGDNLR